MKLPSIFGEKYGPYALVTGASSGIGEEYARQLGAIGLNLVLTARRADRLHNLSEDLKSKNQNLDVRVIVGDLANSSDVAKIIEQTIDVDIGLLINNAGMESFGAFLVNSVEHHKKLVEVNVMAPVVLAHAIGQRLIKKKKGGIIFVSSAGSRPLPFFSTYSGSKAFTSTLATILAHEMRPHGVDVMAVEPGIVDTEMTQRITRWADLPSLRFPRMATEIVVKETLPQLGKTDVFVPGLLNRLMVFLLGLVPCRLRFFILGPYFSRLLAPEMKLAP